MCMLLCSDKCIQLYKHHHNQDRTFHNTKKLPCTSLQVMSSFYTWTLATTDVLSVTTVLEFHINGTILHIIFCLQLFSLSIMLLKCIHIVVYISCSFLYTDLPIFCQIYTQCFTIFDAKANVIFISISTYLQHMEMEFIFSC